MEQYIKKIEAQKEYYHYNLMGLFAIIIIIIIIKKLKRRNAFFC